MAYGYFIEPNRLVVRHEEVSVKGWDPVFDGYRIAMIGDIHGGSNGGSVEKIRRVVETVNAEKVDLIVLLGDYVSERNSGLLMPASEVADDLAGLEAKDGVLAVLGNHDFRYGDEKVAAELERVGYTVLQNEVYIVSREKKGLRFLGLKDHFHVVTWAGFTADAKSAAEPTDGEGPLIVLEHSPDVMPHVTNENAISNDLKLFLGAHSHGGQVWLPIIGRPIVPSAYGQKYAYGHIADRGIDMFVTSGVGTSVLPFRFMVPPEIMIVTIRSA
jgi:predicted MPP superfamily phosphohydrolase